MISYKKLWKLMIDRDIKRKDLVESAGISQFAMQKLLNGKNVTVEILEKICKALNCTMDDLLEILPEEPNNSDEN